MRAMRWTTVMCAVGLALLLVCSTGCHGKKKPIKGLGDDAAKGAEGSEFSDGLNTSINQEDLLFDRNSPSGLELVYFDTNKYTLRPDAREALKRNAEKIKQTPGVIVQIEGHCDERNTQEYNLALGEKRALAVRTYLVQLGVSGDRLLTISYGEESPIALGHDEESWRQNRRCEFNRAR